MFEYLKALRANLLQDLEVNAGKDAQQDRYNAGILAGINEVLNMQINDLIEDETKDDS
jgi:hypothetical protein